MKALRQYLQTVQGQNCGFQLPVLVSVSPYISYESFYKNEGIWEEKIAKNSTAYFDSFSFKTEL